MVSLTKKSSASLTIKPLRQYSSVRDIRLWAGVGLLVVCALIGRATIRGASANSTAVVVVNDLASGATIRVQDVRITQVNVPAPELLLGRRTVGDVYSGDVLTLHDLVAGQTMQMREVTIPLRAGHVPHLSYGDQVDVWVTPSTTGVALPGPAHVIATRALVSGPPDVTDANTDTSITLSVPLGKVQPLVQASQDGSIDVVAVTLLPGDGQGA